MREALLDLLQCPISGTDLRLTAGQERDGEIWEGTLTSGHGHEYPIENGIPNLVVGLEGRVERTGEQFAYEFLQVGEVEDREGKQRRDLVLFFAKTGIDPAFYDISVFDPRLEQDYLELGYEPDFSFLREKRVLDAGCGDGRFARLATPHVREMILLDIGEQIYKAREETANLGNVHCVRCNLLHVPIKEEVVDFAYSIGVIHHTQDPSGAFGEIARCVVDGGWMSVWVYPPEYWGHPMKKVVTQTIRRWLLSQPLESQVAFIRRYLLPLGRIQMGVARHKPLKYLLAPLFLVNVPRHEDRNEMEGTVIDYYLPEYIWIHTDEELAQLFAANDLTYEHLPFPTAAKGRKA